VVENLVEAELKVSKG